MREGLSRHVLRSRGKFRNRALTRSRHDPQSFLSLKARRIKVSERMPRFHVAFSSVALQLRFNSANYAAASSCLPFERFPLHAVNQLRVRQMTGSRRHTAAAAVRLLQLQSGDLLRSATIPARAIFREENDVARSEKERVALSSPKPLIPFSSLSFFTGNFPRPCVRFFPVRATTPESPPNMAVFFFGNTITT